MIHTWKPVHDPKLTRLDPLDATAKYAERLLGSGAGAKSMADAQKFRNSFCIPLNAKR